MSTNKSSNGYKPNVATNKPDFDFSLPTDVAAERALIATLLDNPDLMADALELLGSGEVLTQEGYQILFSILTTLYDEGRTIKLGTVVQELRAKGHYDRLIELGISLQNLPAEGRSTEFIDTAVYLRSLWVKRTAVESASQILSSVRSGETVSQLVDKITSAAEAVSAGLSIGTEPTMSDILRQSLDNIEAALSKPGTLTGVQTGLGKLNRSLGGWQNSDVIMIAGRPGMGKSVMGVFHAIAAAKEGVPVGFLSLEMPSWSLMNRIIAHETGIPYGRIKIGDLSEAEVVQVHNAMGRIEKLPIHFYDEPNKDINDLSYKLLHWKKKHKIGLVIIDYVQKMTDRTIKTADEYAVLTSVSNKLQTLQRRLQIPIIELAQLNRAVEGRHGSKRAGMSDLRSTGQFKQDATVIIMLYRDDYYKEKAARDAAESSDNNYVEPIYDQQLELGLVKSRDGSIGTAVVWADVAINRVADERPMQTLSNSFPVRGQRDPNDDIPF
ncbi:replicative DNA helicase [Spirosoma foliorum]|uniref:DNA 5'-3' helicase n=1 Tax=Spirosoma foliorum TaxID=2710596 RepID=A0A7G5H5D9_9BACT|nr:DnaB-like helicase C-terminal domain-containing protein [Spirosoma foliorum]QMW06331.1 AAA family ATPase [Spirosoma foliorum]